MALPYDATAPAVARTFVVEHGSQLSSDVISDAELLVSELVTNALRHGHPDISVQMSTNPPCVGVAVRDGGGTEAIVPRSPAPAETSGRGLMIVDAVASSWGVTAEQPPPGKTVWFELGGH